MGGSAGKYSPKTTSLEIMAEYGQNAKDQYVIVTGGNSGLGYECSRALAEYGAHVVIACRNPQLGKEAVDKIKAAHPSADVSTMVLDLASLASVDHFVEEYKATKKPIHILLNNAGVMACPKAFTKDGHEMQFGTNHLGHFALTLKLMDVLQTSSTPEHPVRVISLSSIGHYLVNPPMGIRFDDLKGEHYYDQWERYSSSKLANLLFAKELHRRFHSKTPPIVSVAVHPGFINETNLGRHGHQMDFVKQCVYYGTIGTLLTSYFKNTLEGSATSLYAALAPDIVSGEYYADCKVEDSVIHKNAKREDLASELWKVSCELTGVPNNQ